jgi:hypothetical protein
MGHDRDASLSFWSARVSHENNSALQVEADRVGSKLNFRGHTPRVERSPLSSGGQHLAAPVLSRLGSCGWTTKLEIFHSWKKNCEFSKLDF